MAIKKTKRRNKKKGGPNKNRRNTKRNQRGGLIHQIKCDINGKNCTYGVFPFSDSEKYPGKFPIVSPNKKTSIFDFIPKNQENEIDLFSGKTDDNKKKPIDRKSIKEVIYVREKEDLEMIDLFEMMNKEESIKNAMKDIFLSKPDLLKKTTILRLLYKLYKSEDINNEIVYDRTRGNITIGEIKGSVTEISLKDQRDLFELIRGTFKNKYRPDHSKNISTNIFKNGLLEDCYGDISDTDIIGFMTIVIGDNEKNKFSHIYSPENYDYIRQAILFYVINSQFKDFGVFIEAFKEVVEDATQNIQDSVDNELITKIMTELTKQIDTILDNDTRTIDDRKTEILKLVSSKTKDQEINERINERINEKIVDKLMNQLQPDIQSLNNNSSPDYINNEVKSLISSKTKDQKIIDAAMDRYNKNLVV